MSRDDRAHHPREAWPIRRFKLGEEPSDDLGATTIGEERLAMMWQLALDAWASAGRQLPEYTRENMPGRVIRPGDPKSS